MKTKTRVGIDCDGVLRDFIGKTMELCAEEGVYLSRPTDWDYIDKVKIGDQTLRGKIWNSKEWLKSVFEDADVLPFARKGYDAFVEDDDFEVFIVTSQAEGTEYLTEQWLEANGFDRHDEIYFEFDKTQAPAQILIDDKPSHIKDYHSVARDAYLVTSSHNLDSVLRPRVDNLFDAYIQIKENIEKGKAYAS